MPDMNADEAKTELIRVLELNPGASWEDVVYYAAKARSSLRMANQAVRRRTEQLNTVVGLPSDGSWPQALSEVAKHWNYSPREEGE